MAHLGRPTWNTSKNKDKVCVIGIRKSATAGHMTTGMINWRYVDLGKTFNMNTSNAMFPDEFYSYVGELQEQLAEGKIDGVIIRNVSEKEKPYKESA